jgi:hypothetical protein
MPDAPANPATPPRRELEHAPLHLRTASKVLIGGAVLPWMTAVSTVGHVPWGHWAGSVALTFLAGYVLIESAKARRGLPANGAVAGIAKGHAFAGTGLALLVFVGACVVAWMGSAWFNGDPLRYTGVEGPEAVDRYSLRALLELMTLLLGLATFAHILDYEYGGKFNPLFPLMFLGPAVAGSLQVFGAFKVFGENSTAALISLVGSITVAAGGCMAMYTMYESMKEAKLHGDQKREAQREARKTERAAGGAGGSRARRTPGGAGEEGATGEASGSGEAGGTGSTTGTDSGSGTGNPTGTGSPSGTGRPGGQGRSTGTGGGTPRRPRA